MKFFRYFKIPSFHIAYVLNDFCEAEISLVRQAATDAGVAVEDSTIVPDYRLPRNISHPAWQKLNQSSSNTFYVHSILI
jgi:hypothetical protein